MDMRLNPLVDDPQKRGRFHYELRHKRADNNEKGLHQFLQKKRAVYSYANRGPLRKAGSRNVYQYAGGDSKHGG